VAENFLAATAIAKRQTPGIMVSMLTYETVPDSSSLLIGTIGKRRYRINKPIQEQFVGELPNTITGAPFSALAVPQDPDDWTLYSKMRSTRSLISGTTIVFGCLDNESAYLSAGQLGLWREYRRNLVVEEQSLYSGWQSLNTWAKSWLTIGNPSTNAEAEGPTVQNATLLRVVPTPQYLLSTASTYSQCIQDELGNHAVRLVFYARTVQKALRKLRDRISLVSIHISALLAVLFSGIIFCSVRWEKRRWFLFHGARPPKSTAQALWACLLEAGSGSALA
jgi:hypothetical protein